MLRLFEHLKLVLVEFVVNLVHLQGLLPDDLHSARHGRATVLTDLDHAEVALTDLFRDLVVLGKRRHILKLHLLPIVEELGLLLCAEFHRRQTMIPDDRTSLKKCIHLLYPARFV